jgi:putative transposase
MGTIKGRTAIRIFGKYKHLKERPYWVNSFWPKGYYVNTVGLNEEMIRKYVKYQEKKDKRGDKK